MQDWEDVIQLYGCGKFVSDSWRIFCLGDTSGRGVQDLNLKRYVSWFQSSCRDRVGSQQQQQQQIHSNSKKMKKKAVQAVEAVNQTRKRPNLTKASAKQAGSSSGPVGFGLRAHGGVSKRATLLADRNGSPATRAAARATRSSSLREKKEAKQTPLCYRTRQHSAAECALLS